MGYYRNTSDSAQRVDDGTGRLRRVAPGAVVEASGDFEDNLKSRDGVESASKEDFQNQGHKFSSDTRDQDRDRLVTDMASYANLVTTAVPLNEVIGDDDAPYGPPTGTITTRQAAKHNEGNPVGKNLIGHHEWNNQNAEGRDLSPIEQLQYEQSEKVHRVTEAFQEGKDLDASEVKGTAGPEKRGGRGDRSVARISATKERKKPGPKPKAKPDDKPAA